MPQHCTADAAPLRCGSIRLQHEGLANNLPHNHAALYVLPYAVVMTVLQPSVNSKQPKHKIRQHSSCAVRKTSTINP